LKEPVSNPEVGNNQKENRRVVDLKLRDPIKARTERVQVDSLDWNTIRKRKIQYREVTEFLLKVRLCLCNVLLEWRQGKGFHFSANS